MKTIRKAAVVGAVALAAVLGPGTALAAPALDGSKTTVAQEALGGWDDDCDDDTNDDWYCDDDWDDWDDDWNGDWGSRHGVH
ncbi:hypothetical protein [Saccharothrix hoggarensis]|uniref:Secreted protein n=1 Tax=Saccharothrix hoggarensis TaxID=913853 RepID=A0ABW3QLD7_9PSEU